MSDNKDIDVGGRPTLYKVAYNKQAYKLCLLGATDKDLADFFEVKEQTINNWKKSHPKFFESIKKGKQSADTDIAESLYKRAKGYSHKAVKIFNEDGKPMIVPYTEHYAPDTTAAIFWLKNRKPDLWRDKQEIDHTSKGDKLGTVPIITIQNPDAAE